MEVGSNTRRTSRSRRRPARRQRHPSPGPRHRQPRASAAPSQARARTSPGCRQWRPQGPDRTTRLACHLSVGTSHFLTPLVSCTRCVKASPSRWSGIAISSAPPFPFRSYRQYGTYILYVPYCLYDRQIATPADQVTLPQPRMTARRPRPHAPYRCKALTFPTDAGHQVEATTGAIPLEHARGHGPALGLSREFTRKTKQDSANSPASAGGHVEAGETAAEAAIREVTEEAGLRVRLLPGPAVPPPSGFPHQPVTAPWWVSEMPASHGEASGPAMVVMAWIRAGGRPNRRPRSTTSRQMA
jgi:8-oxo-dGTP pyrophosphatase MutT (NUDIX family)